MSLQVNIRQLAQHSKALKGELAVAEMQWETHDDLIRITQPLHYELALQKLENSILVQGSLRQPLDCTCVRCLKSCVYAVELAPWSCLLPLEGEEKVTVVQDCVDLTPFIREDIFLAFPQHPLCGPQCDGLASPQTAKESGVRWESENASVAWAELNKLKLK